MKTNGAWSKRNWRPKVGWGVPVAWLTLCVVWSSTWLVIKIGLRDLPPISYAGIRFVIAVIVLLAISIGRVRFTRALLGLRGPGFYWRLDVCRELRTPFLGRTARFIRVGSGVAGDNPDLRDGVRTSDASGRTNASAKTRWLSARAWWRSANMRPASWFQRDAGVLGRPRHCIRS